MLELTFLKLGLLWGAAGVAAPIVVHLVMRQKPRLVPFPALRFVRASHLASALERFTPCTPTPLNGRAAGAASFERS